MYDVLVKGGETFNGQASVADHLAGDAVKVEQSAIGASGDLASGPERRSAITPPAPSTTEDNGCWAGEPYRWHNSGLMITVIVGR